MEKNTMTARQQKQRVIADYESAYPDPLVIHAGEELAVDDRPTEWDGWLWCTAHSGKEGWVPEAYVERNGDTCLALRHYDATELTVHTGEELVAGEEAGGWLWCTNRLGQSGWVPADHLEPVDLAQNRPEG